MLSRMQVKYHLQNNLGTTELSFEFISQKSKKREKKEKKHWKNPQQPKPKEKT